MDQTSSSDLSFTIPEKPTTHDLDHLIPKLVKDTSAISQIERKVRPQQYRCGDQSSILADGG